MGHGLPVILMNINSIWLISNNRQNESWQAKSYINSQHNSSLGNRMTRLRCINFRIWLHLLYLREEHRLYKRLIVEYVVHNTGKRDENGYLSGLPVITVTVTVPKRWNDAGTE